MIENLFFIGKCMIILGIFILAVITIINIFKGDNENEEI
jgi:hypothetical protein